MKKHPTTPMAGVSPWTLAAFLLPAAALVYLFIWSQGGDAYTARTEIQRAALALEGLAEDALQACVDERAGRAARRPATGQGEILSGLTGIPFTCRTGEQGGVEVIEPAPAPAKELWSLPGDDQANRLFQVYQQDLDEQEFIRKDLDRVKVVLEAMQGPQFSDPAFKARTLLARAAFLKRHDRFGEVEEELRAFIRDTDPCAAPDEESLPFTAAAFVLLADRMPISGKPGADNSAATGEPSADDLQDPLKPRDDAPSPAGGSQVDDGQVKEESEADDGLMKDQERFGELFALLQAMSRGEVPLNPGELRAVGSKMPPEFRRGLENRARDLDLVDLLQGDPGLAAALSERSPFVVLRGDKLLLGSELYGEYRGAALPGEAGIQALLAGAMIDSVPGLLLKLAPAAAPDDEQPEIIRSKDDPAGIRGAKLQVLLMDQGLFEQTVASRKVFVLSTGLILILAMILLGFATFRAVRREVEAAKARTDFMTAVSHELRTPLASIRMFAELLEEDRVESPEMRLRFMRLIISNSRRLTAMIENVLDLGRSERGVIRFHLEEVHLKRLLDDLFRDLGVAAEEDGFEMEVEIADDLPVVRADPSGLTRALFNLFDNARKYAGDDKRITIKAEAHQGGALISIQDRGPGIALAERERIFQRYRRGKKGEAAAAGAGLGLSLSREAVEACGGTLTLESREGEGSTFYIFLPAMMQDA